MSHLDQVNKVRRAMVSHHSPQDSRTVSSPASTDRPRNHTASSHKEAHIPGNSSLMDKPRNLDSITPLQARLQVDDLLLSTVRPPGSPASNSMALPASSSSSTGHQANRNNRSTRHQQVELVKAVILASSSKYCNRECKIRISRRFIHPAH